MEIVIGSYQTHTFCIEESSEKRLEPPLCWNGLREFCVGNWMVLQSRGRLIVGSTMIKLMATPLVLSSKQKFMCWI